MTLTAGQLPTPEQQAILHSAKESKDSMMITAMAGTGKALRNDQLVLTPTGYKTISILQIGDLVIGLDGKPYPVLGVFPQGIRDIFELKFSDSTSIFADAEHIWKTQNTTHRYHNKFVLKTTRELAQKPRTPSKGGWGNGTRAYWFFPMCAPVLFGLEKHLPFDPWALGILLGDGHLGEKSVTFASADAEIVEGMRIAVMPFDVSIKYQGQYDYRITTVESARATSGRLGLTGYENKLLTIMRQLNLAGTMSDTKFVPKDYLFALPRHRLAILQGLMDSDGSAEKSGAEFSSASFELAENVRFLVHSLGGTTSVTVRETTGKLSYRVRIKFPANLPLFRLQRKLARMGGGQRPNPFRALESITFAGQAEATCISVASPDNMFLIENCIPTHNTSTLVLLANALPVQPAIALAFNVSIKKELERRFPPFWKIMTLNGLGHLAWMRAIRGKQITLDERKLGRLTTSVFKDFGYEGDEDAWGNVRQLVEKAMQAGIVPASRPHKGFRPDTAEQWAMLADENWLQGVGEMEVAMAREVLARSVAEGFEGTISFSDQIYLPVLFNGQFPRYPLLMGDEVQDWSVMNRVMAQRTCSGRFILVGDPAQAIYRFRGADAGSMQRLRALRPHWIDLPLSVTFRCPKVVVDRQQRHVPGFQAYQTNAIGKIVKHSRFGPDQGGKKEPVGPLTWDWKWIECNAGTGSLAILSRNNAPLLKIAFKLLRQNVPVTMLGRDIGKTLVALSKRVLPDDDMLAPECIQTVEAWKDSQLALANANGQEDKAANIHDQAECLLAVIGGARAENAAAIRWYLKELFARSSGHVTISTIHRAKGLEWNCVLHLDPWRIPSKYAQHNPAQMQQEMNLQYVCETRCSRVLIEANLEDFE